MSADDSLPPAPRGWRVSDVPGSHVTEPEVIAMRLLSAGDYERAEDGTWSVCWHTALTDRRRPLTDEEIRTQILMARMRPSAATPLPDAELAAVTPRLVQLLEERETKAAEPRPPADLVTVERSWAGRIMRGHEVWAGKDGRLYWRRWTPDPVLGRGQGRSVPTPPPTPGGWLRRRQPPADAAVLTAETLAEHVALHPGVRQVGEDPDFGKVISELCELVKSPP